MDASTHADFLVEIGTEELPPKALPELRDAFAANLEAALQQSDLEHGSVRAFASPRRLAVLIEALAASQPERESELRGPPVAVAFDGDGSPTAAARAFAEKCGVDVEALGRTRSKKGEWLCCRRRERGMPAAELLPGMVEQALEKLPVPRRMRWGDSPQEFVRPVHWLLLLHGDEVMDATVLGLSAGRETRGHRFMAPGTLEIGKPGDYLQRLKSEGCVLADFSERRERIVDDVHAAARKAGGEPVADDGLYDEVTALTEWPVVLTAHFDESFLELPREVIVATLTGHQRYFPIADGDGRLLNRFVVVANLESKAPARVRDGNERVVRPRLADAAFFWTQDRRKGLAACRSGLASVVYQQGLGSLEDRSRRIAALAAAIAERLGGDTAVAERAARLAKCDLLSGMVGEFPELQGTMGRHYALAAGEPAAVAAAIGEQYLPRYAGDELPTTPAGQALALADKLDTLAGAFALGKKPSGNRDPFGLRRAALGIVRIAVEKGLEFDLAAMLDAATAAQPAPVEDPGAAADELYDFIVERMRAWYGERRSTPAEVFESVRLRRPVSLLDFDLRLQAVSAFLEMEQAESLAAANKRIANILRQAGHDGEDAVDESLLEAAEEKTLHAAIVGAAEDIRPWLKNRDYRRCLARLADLRETVDRFFDEVMVMTDDPRIRQNRLALLASLRALFLEIADVSRLSIR